MNFIKTEIPGVVIIEPKVHQDPRGFFYESYCEKLFVANGIKDHFVQDNISFSAKGILRGIHCQVAPCLPPARHPFSTAGDNRAAR